MLFLVNLSVFDQSPVAREVPAVVGGQGRVGGDELAIVDSGPATLDHYRDSRLEQVGRIALVSDRDIDSVVGDDEVDPPVGGRDAVAID